MKKSDIKVGGIYAAVINGAIEKGVYARKSPILQAEDRVEVLDFVEPPTHGRYSYPTSIYGDREKRPIKVRLLDAKPVTSRSFHDRDRPHTDIPDVYSREGEHFGHKVLQERVETDIAYVSARRIVGTWDEHVDAGLTDISSYTGKAKPLFDWSVDGSDGKLYHTRPKLNPDELDALLDRLEAK